MANTDNDFPVTSLESEEDGAGLGDGATPSLPSRSSKGTFVKGVSGNKKGRAKGSRNKITIDRLETEQAMREFFRPNAKKVIKRALDIALNGDPNENGTIAMLKILLDKTMSSLRNEDVGESKDTEITVNINKLTVGNRDRVTVTDVIEGEVLPRLVPLEDTTKP